jgi:hypothetical protein
MKTVILLGEGTVVTGVACNSETGTLIFKRVKGEPGKPGQKIDSYPGLVTVGDADVLIEFATLQSIDQMIENLNLLKSNFPKQP